MIVVDVTNTPTVDLDSMVAYNFHSKSLNILLNNKILLMQNWPHYGDTISPNYIFKTYKREQQCGK